MREAPSGEAVWEGVVEVFDLPSCAAGSRCYAWSYRDGGEMKSMIVLETATVTSALRAVQAALKIKTRARNLRAA